MKKPACTREQLIRGLKMFVTVVKMHERGISLVVSPEEERRIQRKLEAFVRLQRRRLSHRQ